MNKSQVLAITVSLILFAGLYFGFDTKPVNHQTVERSRAVQGESTSFESLLEKAQAQLGPEQSEQIRSLEQKLQGTAEQGEKIALMKQLSGLWYRFGHLPVAGVLAERVAEVENADSSWSVAGATFFNGLMRAQDAAERQYCAEHAVIAFESAASLAPDKPEHRVNLALVWAENPPPNNPMQAVTMLRDLESKYPEAPSVYNALGRLAIKTGQWQRAIDRLEKAHSLEPNNPNTPCLLAQAYEGAGNKEKATEFANKCGKTRQ
jgi:cytochrome c-type biogenesis protein CcmH/NrfG